MSKEIKFSKQEIAKFNGLHREVESGCWEWQGSIQKPCATRQLPYGVFHFQNTQMGAHRASYIIHHGQIPQGLHVLHSCDNASCVNPDHLRTGTPQDNADDRRIRGRSKGFKRAKSLRPHQVAIARVLAPYCSDYAIAEYLGTSPTVARLVRLGRTHKKKRISEWRAKEYGYIWIPSGIF